jgi:hypothetical protein
MKPLLFLTLLHLCLHSKAQSQDRITTIDAYCRSLSQQQLSLVTDTVQIRKAQSSKDLKIVTNLSLDQDTLRCIQQEVYFLDTHPAKEAVTHTITLFYYQQNQLIKVSEQRFTGRATQQTDWYFENAHLLAAAPASEEAEPRSRQLLDLSQTLRRQFMVVPAK